MSKKANPTFIGSFVLVGLAVSVIAIMVLGGFNFKDDSVHFASLTITRTGEES